MDFLFFLIELLSLRVTAEALQANIDWKSAFLKPNFHIQGDVPPGDCEPFLH